MFFKAIDVLGALNILHPTPKPTPNPSIWRAGRGDCRADRARRAAHAPGHALLQRRRRQRGHAPRGAARRRRAARHRPCMTGAHTGSPTAAAGPQRPAGLLWCLKSARVMRAWISALLGAGVAERALALSKLSRAARPRAPRPGAAPGAQRAPAPRAGDAPLPARVRQTQPRPALRARHERAARAALFPLPHRPRAGRGRPRGGRRVLLLHGPAGRVPRPLLPAAGARGRAG